MINTKHLNKQKLLGKIIHQYDRFYFDIKFDVDNTIIKKIFLNSIKSGDFKHPDLVLYPFNNKIVFKTNDYENSKLLASQCKTRADFRKNHNSAYQFAYKYNFLDEICNHMILANKYDLQQVKIIALNYTTRRKFAHSKDAGAYTFALKNGYLDEICSHMITRYKTYNFEMLKEIALKYNNRNEFAQNDSAAYKWCSKNNLLNIVCKHMIPLINQLDFPRLIYIYEFSDKTVYIGLTKNFKIRHRNRIALNNDYIMQYIIATGLKPKIKFLTKYLPAEIAQQKEKEFILEYKNNGYNILNKNSGGSLGGYCSL